MVSWAILQGKAVVSPVMAIKEEPYLCFVKKVSKPYMFFVRITQYSSSGWSSITYMYFMQKYHIRCEVNTIFTDLLLIHYIALGAS